MLANQEPPLTYSQVFVRINDGTEGPSSFNPGLLSEIDLPDGTKYSFLYHNIGTLAQVTTPTGAVVQYTYQQTSSAFFDDLFQLANQVTGWKSFYPSGGIASQGTITYSNSSTQVNYQNPDGTLLSETVYTLGTTNSATSSVSYNSWQNSLITGSDVTPISAH